ncbi:MAG: hypothetical protein QM734_08760 [Cyclobacteriaceae bacterium]
MQGWVANLVTEVTLENGHKHDGKDGDRGGEGNKALQGKAGAVNLKSNNN